ncbi:hypothetical protein ACIF9R_04095 [Streptomyces sp. NPDC086080]|uniref:hypothetical protein n=1 Tax=Streptomyces sp. NPDC086080 TaxID=3365748 RepID=UPI0037D168B9
MSRPTGPHTADPCPRCFHEAVRLGAPRPAADPRTVDYSCDRCGHCWDRPVENDLEIHDTVRADLLHATLYGEVWQLEDDRILIRGGGGGGGAWRRWVERWRVILY